MKSKILLLDIETTPSLAYVWGLFRENIPLARLIESGRVLCWSAKWLGDRHIYFGRELEEIHALLEEADVVVHYNGRRFDIPTLNRAFVKEGLSPPSSYQQVDLLSTVRSQFRFVSNKLDHVVQELGLGKKQETSFSDWIGCMEGDEKAWRKMERYNKNDVRILERLYKKLLPWIPNHPNVNLIEGKGDGCPKCGSKKLHKRGFHIAATRRYQRYQCQKCGAWARSRTADKEVLAEVR